eukprot:14706155-Alexandrium_andersonii.AAC.1
MPGARKHLGNRRCWPYQLGSRSLWARAARETALPCRATLRPTRTRLLRRACKSVPYSRGPSTRSSAL